MNDSTLNISSALDSLVSADTAAFPAIYLLPADAGCILPADTVLPVDSAFLGGTKAFPESVLTQDAPASVCCGVCLADILSVVSVLLCVIFLKRLYCALPYMASCLLRWKEALALEYSVSISRDRNLFFVLMIVPMAILLDRYDIYSPDFLGFIPEDFRLLGTVACLAAFILLRLLLLNVSKMRKTPKDAYSAAGGLFRTVFCLAAVSLVLVSGVLGRFGVADGTIRTVILCCLSVFWVLLLLRKGQIFAHNCTVFSTILYLCVLEIVPTGLMVASAMLL
ncbi:MAG: hypothetical protein ACI395_04265 [Candidatus Cryptobacteroides sp.]